MSTRAPFPNTSLIWKKACGGAGLTALSSRSEAWILVRALMLFLATTTCVPVVFVLSSGRPARPADLSCGGGHLSGPAAWHDAPLGATYSTRLASTSEVLIP